MGDRGTPSVEVNLGEVVGYKNLVKAIVLNYIAPNDYLVQYGVADYMKYAFDNSVSDEAIRRATLNKEWNWDFPILTPMEFIAFKMIRDPDGFRERIREVNMEASEKSALLESSLFKTKEELK